MSDLSMLINGLKVTAEKNATFERRNPLDGSVATRAPAASPMKIAFQPSRICTWSSGSASSSRTLALACSSGCCRAFGFRVVVGIAA